MKDFKIKRLFFQEECMQRCKYLSDMVRKQKQKEEEEQNQQENEETNEEAME